jgi:hypothetical protein
MGANVLDSSRKQSRKVKELQHRFEDLQRALPLTQELNCIDEIGTELSQLPNRVEEIRTRGYVFHNFLEIEIRKLIKNWEDTQASRSRDLNKRRQDLMAESEKVEEALRQAVASGREHSISRAESAIDTLESKVQAARSAVETIYSSLEQNVDQTYAQVDEIEWLLDQVDEACFQLHPAEYAVLACRAEYIERNGEEGHKGILYLTDSRLLFERKERVVTENTSLTTMKKETVHELLLEVPIGQIEECKAVHKKKLLTGRQEILKLFFTPEADISGATIRLQDGAKNEDWVALINRVKTGEIDKERVMGL